MNKFVRILVFALILSGVNFGQGYAKQQKIEKLKDYKKSLIFECVTGKRKV